MTKKGLILVLTFFVFSLVFFIPYTASAATKYWIGPAAGSFNNNAYWSTTNGGSNDTTAPGSSDVATFTSADTDNAALDSTVNVLGIVIQASYSGSLIQSAGVDVTIGTSGYTQADGIYTGSTGLITNSGIFTLSGGTFTASSATTTIKSTFTRTSGNFVHNNGIVAIEAVSTSFSVAAGSSTFYNLKIFKSQSSSFPIVTITDSFTVANDFWIYNSSTAETFTVQSSTSLNPTVTVQGDLYFPNATSNVALAVGSATVANNFTVNLQGDFMMEETILTYRLTTVFTGTGDQTISRTGGAIASTAWSSTKVSGNLTITAYSTVNASDIITWTSGSVSVSANTVVMNGLSLTGGTMTLAGSTTISSAFTLGGGTFIAAPSATTTFKSTFTRTSGVFTHSNGNVAFEAVDTSFTITPTGVSFYNLSIFKSQTTSFPIVTLGASFTVENDMMVYNSSTANTVTVQSSSSLNPTITVQGDLILPNATNNVALALGSATAANNFTFNLHGDFFMAETILSYYATTVFVGTGAQTISRTGGAIFGSSGPWSSTKGSGTLTITSYSGINSSDNLTWSGGTVSASDNVYFNGLVVSGGTFTLLGSTTMEYAFSLTGGTFVSANDATTTYRYYFTRTAGTYTANNGTTTFNMNLTNNVLTPTGVTFGNVVFTKTDPNASYTMTIDASFSATGNLWILGSGNSTLFVQSRSSINPTITVGGDLNFTEDGSARRVLGSQTVANNLTLNVAGNLQMSNSTAEMYTHIVFNGSGNQTINKSAGLITIPGTWSSTKSTGTLVISTFPISSSADKITWSGGSISTSDTAMNFTNLEVSGGTFTAGANVTIGSSSGGSHGTFTLSGGTFVGSTGTTTFTGSFTKTSGTYTANNGTAFNPSITSGIVYNPNGITFGDFAITKSLATTPQSVTTSLDSSFTVNSLYTTSIVDTTVFFQSRSSLNPTITVQGNYVNTNSAGKTLGSDTAANNFTINLAGNLIISTGLNNRANIVFNGSGDQTINKSGGLNSVGSTWSSTKSSGTLTLSSWVSDSSDKITWSAGAIATSDTAMTITNVEVSGGTFTAGANVTIGTSPGAALGTFTLSGGTFVGSSGTTTFAGNFTRTSGTYTANNGTIFDILQASGITYNPNGATFGEMAITKSSGSTSGFTATLTSGFTTTGNLYVLGSGISNATLVSQSSLNPTITVQGSLIFTGASTPNRVIGSATASANLSIDVAGNFVMSNSSATLHAPVTFSGSGTQTITKSVGTLGSNSIWYVNKSGGAASLGTTLAHPSTFTVQEGVFDINGSTFTATTAFNIEDGGTLRLQGGETSLTAPTFAGSTTVMYTGSSSYTGLKAGNSYNHLMFNGSGTWTLNATLDVNSNLSIVSGTLSTGGNAITLGGNWANSGTFTHGSGTVTLDGSDQSIGGSAATSFYNLIKSVSTARTLTFPIGVVTTIANNTTFTGQSGALLSLRSSSSGSQSSVNISNSGSRSISYVDVKDQNNTNATYIACTTGCVDSLNNTNWFFAAPTVTTGASANVTTTAADIAGSVDNAGGSIGSEHGFAYGTSALLTTTLATSTRGAYSGTGSFSESLSGLTCATNYYFRAYAVNIIGTSTGSIVTFSTSACPVTSGSSGGGSGYGYGYGLNQPLPPTSKGNENRPGRPNSSPSPSPTPTVSPRVILPNTLQVIPYPSPSETTPVQATTTPVLGIISDTISDVMETVSDAVQTIARAVSDIVGGTVDTVASFVSGSARTISSLTREAFASIFENPSSALIVKSLVGSGMVLGVVGSTARMGSSPISISDILLNINRLWGALLTTLGLRRKSPYWGVVFDSKTMQPLDPVIVTVYDQKGKEVQSAITDLDGRYGFLLQPGTYKITTAKSNYAFPSKVLEGRRSDGLHDNLYFGGEITVASIDSVIKNDIPMDAIGFDWNEYIKNEQQLTKFYEPHDRLIKRISMALFIGGFGLAAVLLAYSPNLINTLVFIFYAVMALLLVLNRHSRPFGFISDKATGNKLANAKINIYMRDKETLINQKTSDQFGRYYCLLANGKYYITIERQNDKGVYENASVLQPVTVRHGILRSNIEI